MTKKGCKYNDVSTCIGPIAYWLVFYVVGGKNGPGSFLVRIYFVGQLAACTTDIWHWWVQWFVRLAGDRQRQRPLSRRLGPK